MKKLFILFGFALFAHAVHAQVEIKPGVGINSMNLSKDPESGEVTAQIGWQVGGSILFGKKVYGEAGVFWHSRTTEFSSSTIEEFNFDAKIQGIRVPVMAGVHILGNEETFAALRIFGGGSGFFVTKASGGDLEKDDVESPQWGLFAGAGVDFWLLFIDAKYEWSLTDFSSITEFDVGKHRGIYANIGIRIPL